MENGVYPADKTNMGGIPCQPKKADVKGFSLKRTGDEIRLRIKKQEEIKKEQEIQGPP